MRRFEHQKITKIYKYGEEHLESRRFEKVKPSLTCQQYSLLYEYPKASERCIGLTLESTTEVKLDAGYVLQNSDYFLSWSQPDCPLREKRPLYERQVERYARNCACQ